jgi:hypothetical protein
VPRAGIGPATHGSSDHSAEDLQSQEEEEEEERQSPTLRDLIRNQVSRGLRGQIMHIGSRPSLVSENARLSRIR